MGGGRVRWSIGYQLEYDKFMPEILPDIDFKITVAPRLFLERMQPIAKQHYITELHLDCAGITYFDILNLRCKHDMLHKGLGCQLIAQPDNYDRIQIEIRAEKWLPDPPTRNCYTSAAREILKVPLKEYNASHDTYYRLRVSKGKLQPQPTKTTLTLFRKFALLANHNSLHPLDWGRFYDFVKFSRQRLSSEKLQSLLSAEGFSQSKIKKLSELYEHLWEFKKRR